jgi:hypothetical protein
MVQTLPTLLVSATQRCWGTRSRRGFFEDSCGFEDCAVLGDSTRLWAGSAGLVDRGGECRRDGAESEGGCGDAELHSCGRV